MGKPRLNRRDVRYIMRAVRLRNALSTKSLARKFHMSTHAIKEYIYGHTLPSEDWETNRRLKREAAGIES